MPSPRSVLVSAVAALALTVTGCSTAPAGSPESTAAASAGARTVVAGFYPLAYAVEQIGGSHVSVVNLTPAGGEAHDLELAPNQVATVETADLVVYLDGFQPALDTVVARHPDTAVEVSAAARLLPAAEHGHSHEGEEHSDHQVEGDPAAARDPHFWLDPHRYAAVATQIGDRLAASDPDNAQAYRQAAQTFAGRLTDLDGEFRQGLAHCTSKQLVTAHTAFGYLAEAYGFEQIGISGISPEAEPDPRTMAEVADTIRRQHVTTVYREPLSSPALAEAVAAEAGVEVKVLDPIEGLSDSSAGRDYVEVMRANLAALREGQQCR